MRKSRLGLLLLVALLPLVLWAALPVLSTGSPRATAASLSSRIDQKRRQIDRKKGHERVLSSTVARYSRRIGSLQGDITVLQRRQVSIQVDLDAKRAELARIQEGLRQERIRLVRLRARLAEARVALAGRLVELYKADKPDVVTVVLESDGFADLLERTEFMQRVSDQDARIIDRVRTARADAIRTAKRLDGLEARQTRIAAAIEARRADVAHVSRHSLEGDLAQLEAANARVQAQLAGAPNGSAPAAAGPIRPGSGGLIWPVNGPLVSPFGMRWGRLHAG